MAILPPPVLEVSSQALVYEDGSVTLGIFADPHAGSTVKVTITISGIPSGWTVIPNGGTYDSGTGTWTYTAPAGQIFSGGPTLMPPHDSDVDIPNLTVTAINSNSSQTSAPVTGNIYVTTDAVADTPDLDAHNAYAHEDTSASLDLSAKVADMDGSESITAVYIKGVPAGFTLSAGADQGGGTWLLDVSDLTGLTISAPADYFGTIPLTLEAVATESNKTDSDFDFNNDVAYGSEGFTVTWQHVVHPPVITSDGGGDNAATSVAENSTAVTTVTATDQDVGTILAYSLVGGADQNQFQIDASTGVLEFITAPDFENPTDAGQDNVYDVVVQVSDGDGGIDTQAIAVTVTDVVENTAPMITSDGGGDNAATSVAENSTAVTTVTATDQDVGTILAYSLVGGADQNQFQIDASTGVLEFIAAPDFENPTDAGQDNVYDVVVQVSDGDGGIDTQAIAVTVTDVVENTAPMITSDGGGDNAATSVAENSTAVTTVTATDQDVGTILAYSLVGGADQNQFQIDASTGVLEFIAAPDFENPTDAGQDNVYDVVVQVSDGDGGIDTQAIAVTVTDVVENTAPMITSDGGGDNAATSVAENSTAVTTVTATDQDVGTILAYSLVGGADQNQFQIDASTGVLEFITAPDFENPTDAGQDNVYDVVVQVSDGDGGIDTQAIAVTVTDADEAITNGNGGGRLVGTPGDDLIDGQGGNDRINAGAGNDTIIGGPGRDYVYAGNGDDTIIATIGDGSFDLYAGGAGSDTIDMSGITAPAIINLALFFAFSGQTGWDTLISIENAIGGSGNDVITGNGVNNFLDGQGGDDTINAGWGNDIIIGGAGNDIMNGGLANDVFIFLPGFGNDRILGFDANPRGGQDLLDISAFGITSGDFATRVTITDVGADTLVTIDGDAAQTVLLVGIGDTTTVTQEDFLL